MENPKVVGNAFKEIIKRLSNETQHTDNTRKTITHTCNNCKYCHGQEGYDYQWGMIRCVHSWCDKDKTLMDSWGNNKNHYIESCSYFEQGEGIYEEMSQKEKRKLGL